MPCLGSMLLGVAVAAPLCYLLGRKKQDCNELSRLTEKVSEIHKAVHESSAKLGKELEELAEEASKLPVGLDVKEKLKEAALVASDGDYIKVKVAVEELSERIAALETGVKQAVEILEKLDGQVPFKDREQFERALMILKKVGGERW